MPRRRSLVQQQTRQRNRIHAVLQRNLVDCPATDLFGVSGRRWLTEVEVPPNERLEVKAGIASLARVMGQGVFARDTMVQARKVLANAESAYKMMVAARAVQEGRGRLNEGTTRWPKAGSATEISPSNSALRHEVDRA